MNLPILVPELYSCSICIKGRLRYAFMNIVGSLCPYLHFIISGSSAFKFRKNTAPSRVNSSVCDVLNLSGDYNLSASEFYFPGFSINSYSTNIIAFSITKIQEDKGITLGLNFNDSRHDIKTRSGN